MRKEEGCKRQDSCQYLHNPDKKFIVSNIPAENDIVNNLVDTDRFDCTLCEIAFETEGLLKSHVENLHKLNEILLSCNQCKYRAISPTQFHDHMNNLHTVCPQFTCDICNFSAKSKGGLTKHKNVKHQNTDSDRSTAQNEQSNIFSCGLCNFTGDIDNVFRIHEITQHMTTVTCHQCSYTFVEAELANHLKLHKNLVCEECDFETDGKFDLNEHKKRKHKRENYYPCDYCDYETVSSRLLFLHEQVHFQNL